MEFNWILGLIGSILLACIPPSLQIRYCGSDSGQMEVWGENCYGFPYNTAMFDHAVTYCKDNYGAELASILSAEESKYVNDKMKSVSYSKYWIGMKKDNTDKDPLKENYYWLDGAESDYENWAPGEPNDSGGVEHCVEVYTYNTLEGMWNDARCDYLYQRYVCKATLVAGWQEFEGNQYYMASTPDEIDATWYEARDWCRQRGADVASILTDAEKVQVATWAGKNNYKGDLWIGLNKLAGKRDAWGWSDGSGYSWENWKDLYPIEEEYSHLCGYQASDDKEGRWVNGHCDTRRGFVCKRPITSNPTPKTTQPTESVKGFCPPKYTGYGNKCFKVVMPGQMGQGALTFDQALKKCRSEPGFLPSLASIHSDLEQAYVSAHLQELRLGVWIGLKRTLFGEDWTWVDSSPYGYQQWAPDKPQDPNGGHCAEVWMLPGSLGKWNNVKCSDKRGYVCQTYKDAANVIPTSAAPSVNFTCPPEFTPYWYGCFRYESTSLSYERASAQCKSLNADATLVGIHMEAENAAIQTMSISQNTDLWIGLKDTGDDGEYKWEDNWWILFVNWANGQPAKDVGGGCVYMSQNGKWSDANCNIQKPSVCKISKVPTLTTPATMEGFCPPGTGWLNYHEHCYLFLPNEYYSWRQAKQECQNKGFLSSLVSIHSYTENKMINDRLNEMGAGRDSVWIGLYRSTVDRTQMKWTDGSSLQYEAWAPNEPNGGVDDNEDCVEMYNEHWPGKWNDHNCYHYKGFVCKAPKTPRVSVPTLPPQCESGWKYFLLTGACYLFQPDNLRSFKVAQQFCKERGAKIASIHGAFENKYIEEEMKAASNLPSTGRVYFWIGLFPWKTENMLTYKYNWTDKTEFDYENWYPNYPISPASYPCVYADRSSGKWLSARCTYNYGFVCKTPQKSTQMPGALNGGQVAGVVIGVFAGVILLAFIVVAVLTHKQIIDNPISRFTKKGTGLETSVNYEKTI